MLSRSKCARNKTVGERPRRRPPEPGSRAEGCVDGDRSVNQSRRCRRGRPECQPLALVRRLLNHAPADPGSGKPARRAGTPGLGAAIWRWLRRVLLRPRTLRSIAAPPAGGEAERSPAAATVATAPHAAASEASPDETVRQSSRPAFIDGPVQPRIRVEDDASTPAAAICPRPTPSELAGEGHPQPLAPAQESAPAHLEARREKVKLRSRATAL